jgi:hypothetical protein
MAQFKAYSPNVTVNGETVLSIVDGMGTFRDTALEILARRGIKNPQPGQWYNQQAWLNAFQEIHQKIGVNTLYRIGLSIPENAKLPPGINDVEKALGAIDVAYHMNHRGGEIGHYGFSRSAQSQGTMTCRNPYPCDFDRGIIEAMAKRFKPAGSLVKVLHDTGGPCRKNGGDACRYLVSW